MAEEKSFGIDALNLNADQMKNDKERAQLIELWDTMKKHHDLESGATSDSLHAKYLRFTMEKEFVEMLSNPRYLQHLAQRNLFDDDRFIRYLQYLQYWRTPKYAKCIKHVHALRFLELLQNDVFRRKLKEPAFVEMVHQNQYYHWNFSKTNEFQHKYQIKETEQAALPHGDGDIQMKH